MASPRRTPGSRPRYRVVCYELAGGRESVVMEATGEGFVAATGTMSGGRMRGELSGAGPSELQAHIALMIANHEQLVGEHAAGCTCGQTR